MAKSSNFDPNAYLEKITKAINENNVDPISQTLAQDILKSIQFQTGIAKDQMLTDQKMLSQVTKAAELLMKRVGVGAEKGGAFKGDLDAIVEKLKNDINKKIFHSTELAVNSISNAISSHMTQTTMAESKGKKGSLTGVVSEKTEPYLKEINSRIGGTLNKINQAQDFISRMFNWVKGDSEENRKSRKTFGYQLLDALEKSKFIGGALRDTVRLFGLMGARWLSQFGPVGRWVGGIFYALSEVLGPFIVQGILKGMGALFAKYIPMLVLGIGKGVLGLGKFGWGNVVGTAVGTAGAVWAFSEAGDSWKKGKRGQATSFGVGGTALGVGGIALGATGLATAGAASAGAAGTALMGAGATGAGALLTSIASSLAGVASILGPIGWTLIAVGAGIALFTKLWKSSDEEGKERLKKILEFISPLYFCIRTIQRGVDWVKEHFGGDDSRHEKPSGSAGARGGKTGSTLLSDKTDSTGHLAISKMTAADWKEADTLDPIYGSKGEILNLGKMSQKRAAEVIRADIEKKGNKSYYEIGDRKLVDKGQFLTDAADKDNVYFVRGTNDAVKKQFDRLSAAGYDVSKAKITAGIGTLGSPERMSPHTYRDSINGHFGTTSSVDISGVYKDGRRVYYADYRKHLSGIHWGQSESDHEHWAFGHFGRSYNMYAKKRGQKEDSQEVSTVGSMEAMKVASKVLPLLSEEKQAEYNRLVKESQDKGVNADIEGILNKIAGVHKEKAAGGDKWVVDDAKSGVSALLWDPTGNDQFTKQATQILANGGT